jgi:hypothetical protein
LRRRSQAKQSQLLQSCEKIYCGSLNPGFQSKHFHPTRAALAGTPAWAGISERFQRYLVHQRFQSLKATVLRRSCRQKTGPLIKKDNHSPPISIQPRKKSPSHRSTNQLGSISKFFPSSQGSRGGPARAKVISGFTNRSGGVSPRLVSPTRI